MLRLMGSKGHVRVIADQVGTPTAASSLAEVIWGVGESAGSHWYPPLDGSRVASWYDFAVAIAEESAAIGLLPATVRVDPITTEEYPTPAKRPAYSVLDKRTLLESSPFRHIIARQPAHRAAGNCVHVHRLRGTPT